MRFLNIAIAIGFICMLSLSGWAQPVIQMDTYSVDFGYSYPEQALNHEFTVINKGDQDLIIERVRTSCGCTAAIPSATTIPAGATSIVSVTMTTNSAPSMHKTATVMSNDPKNPMVQLDLITKIHQVWTIKPKSNVQFGEVPYGTSVSETIYLENMDGDHKVVSTKLNRPEFVQTVMEPTEEGIPIKITFTAPDKEGFISDTLNVLTDDQRQPRLQIAVLGKAVGPVHFSPSRLFFANMKVGENKDRQVTAQLYNKEGQEPLKITGIKADTDALKGEVINTHPDGSVVMKFSYNAPDKVGLQRGKVTLVTNNESAPEVELNYSALVHK